MDPLIVAVMLFVFAPAALLAVAALIALTSGAKE